MRGTDEMLIASRWTVTSTPVGLLHDTTMASLSHHAAPEHHENTDTWDNSGSDGPAAEVTVVASRVEAVICLNSTEVYQSACGRSNALPFVQPGGPASW